MADAPEPLSDAFAPPSDAAPTPRADLGRAARFVARRGLRLVVSPVVLAVCAIAVLGRLDWPTIAAIWVLGVALWLPPTAVHARVEFFPGPPDRGLRDDQGRPTSERDQRLLLRAVVGEQLLGSLPALILAVWMSVGLDLPLGVGLGAGLALAALLLWGDGRTLAGWWLREATLDLLAGHPEIARRRLEPAARWMLGGHRDWLHHLLALARFRCGDPEGALAAVDEIRATEVWQTAALRAQMAVAHGALDEAEALAARLATDPEQARMATTLQALVDLHRGRPERVAEQADALLAGADEDSRSTIALLVAAAVAPADPERARRLLREHRWDPERLRALERTWPAVHGPLAALDGGGFDTLR